MIRLRGPESHLRGLNINANVTKLVLFLEVDVAPQPVKGLGLVVGAHFCRVVTSWEYETAKLQIQRRRDSASIYGEDKRWVQRCVQEGSIVPHL